MTTFYRIRDKQTKQFFQGNGPWYDRGPRWADKGVFFQNVEPVQRWLLFLAGCAIAQETQYSQKFTYKKTRGWRQRLKRYEVVVSDVAIRKSRKIRADKFIGDPA